ncbi:hypothetical protein PG988_005726 [Apiospora saccharicola]
MRSLYGKHLNRDIKKLHDHYGDVVRVGPNTVSFATTGALSAVHSAGGSAGGDKESFTKKGTIEWLLGAMSWSATNILTAVNPKAHEKLRKAVQPAFTIRELRKQEAIQQNWITTYHARLDLDGREDAEINITEHMSQLVWDMLGDLSFGNPLPKSQLVKFNRLKKIACTMSPVLEVMQNVLAIPLVGSCTKAFVTSFPGMFQIPRDILPVGTLRDYVTLERTDRSHDFLSAIVGTERKGIHLTQDELQSNAAMLVMVGQDATVTCLSSTLYFLLRDPKQMARLRVELSETFPTESEITGEAISRLPFLNGAVHEAMRLISPANGMGTHRQSQGGWVEGLWIPAGVTVAVDQHTIQRSPRYWKYPEEYRPERWFPPTGPTTPVVVPSLRATTTPPTAPSCSGPGPAWAASWGCRWRGWCSPGWRFGTRCA